MRPETCRGKRIADIVRRGKKQCIKLEIKERKQLKKIDKNANSTVRHGTNWHKHE